MNTTRLQIGRNTIACHQSRGTGPAVVMLHGNSCSSRAFERQLDGPLGKKLALTAIDLPGHGASPDADDPTTGYCLPGYARVLVEVVGQLGLQHAVFAGWSLGGHVLLEATASLPKAAGFMLIATPPLGNPPDFASAFNSHPVMSLLFQRHWSEEDRMVFAKMAFGQDGAGMAEIQRDLNRADGRARECLGASVRPGGYRDELEIVRTLKRPLAMVLGVNDPLINRAYLTTVPAPTLWRNGLLAVPEAGHAPQWQNAPAFDGLLDGFVKDCYLG